MTGWDRALAAHLRQRSLDAYEGAAIYDAMALDRKGKSAAICRALARRCRAIALRNRWQASQHDPVLVDAATVAAARSARPRRCASCNLPKQVKSVLCAACSRDRRYCTGCGTVRPLDHFWGEARTCRTCYRATRPRNDREQSRANRTAAALGAARAHREHARRRYLALVASVEAAGGMPSGRPSGAFWQAVGAPLGMSSDAARRLYARNQREATHDTL